MLIVWLQKIKHFDLQIKICSQNSWLEDEYHRTHDFLLRARLFSVCKETVKHMKPLTDSRIDSEKDKLLMDLDIIQAPQLPHASVAVHTYGARDWRAKKALLSIFLDDGCYLSLLSAGCYILWFLCIFKSTTFPTENATVLHVLLFCLCLNQVSKKLDTMHLSVNIF